MVPWVSQFRRAMEKESGPPLLMLATIDAAGRPRCRTIVIRGVRDDGRVVACTDARSEKVEQIDANDRVEACVWFADSRTQFRLAGTARLIGPEDDDSARVWRELSDSARALFAWPTPMLPREDEEAFVKGVPSNDPVPETFRVLEVTPTSCDHLALGVLPHERTIWTQLPDGWTDQPVNP